MATWRLDEGLITFRRQWWEIHPGATVYTIGDSAHSGNPDVSQHAPDRGGSKPGDDKGEVDAVDVMPGKGVTGDHLEDLFMDLQRSRDPRVLYAIYQDRIFSSVVQPWKIRTYSGKWHGHVHLSVNDNFDANTSIWKIGVPDVARERKHDTLNNIRLPRLVKGDEDADWDGWNHVIRVQGMCNVLAPGGGLLDIDGVYGAKTAAKVARIMSDQPTRTTSNGSRIELAEWRKLYGI